MSSGKSLPFPDTSTSLTFEEICLLAAESGQPVRVVGNVVLKETIILRKRQRLIIQGGDGGDEHSTNYSITGDLHSLFLLNNHSHLDICNVNLHHASSTDNNDHKQIGAAVNLRYKSTLEVTNAIISSTCGFCVWTVQKTSVKLLSCYLTATLRSAIVCFGQPNCTLDHCRITNSGVHGICARGACHITMSDCKIYESAVRAIYAYANASVTIRASTITETFRKDKAAIEISSSGGSSSSLTMEDCQLVDNAGIGLLLRGTVELRMQNNVIERNEGSNVVKMKALQDETPEDSTGTIKVLQRDPSGSSYRQGDWWCRNCVPTQIVIVNRKECPTCHEPFRSQDQYLTIHEITQCNKGINIIENNNSNNNLRTMKESQWSFDTDSGWLSYDEESNQILEKAFLMNQESVLLSNGKYQVDIRKMEQINLETQFLRLVKRTV